MLETLFLLRVCVCVCVYIYIHIYVCVCACVCPKIQPAITGIAVSFTQDAYKRYEAQRMPIVFRYPALLSTHISICSVGRIKMIFQWSSRV
jgi:hypothetical protein